MNKTIISDIRANFGDISTPTYCSYVDTLKRLFVIEDLRGWSPNIKTKTSIRTGNKKSFYKERIL